MAGPEEVSGVHHLCKCQKDRTISQNTDTGSLGVSSQIAWPNLGFKLRQQTSSCVNEAFVKIAQTWKLLSYQRRIWIPFWRVERFNRPSTSGHISVHILCCFGEAIKRGFQQSQTRINQVLNFEFLDPACLTPDSNSSDRVPISIWQKKKIQSHIECTKWNPLVNFSACTLSPRQISDQQILSFELIFWMRRFTFPHLRPRCTGVKTLCLIGEEREQDFSSSSCTHKFNSRDLPRMTPHSGNKLQLHVHRSV